MRQFSGHAGQRFHLGDFDRHIFRQTMDVFPGERAREFRLKLVTQRHGIMAVAQDEVFADLRGQRRFG